MNEERIAEIVAEAVKAAMKEDRDEFWISQPQHYMDHQLLPQCRKEQDDHRKNHEFITSVRTGMTWGKKAGWVTITVSTLGFLGTAIWMAIKAALHYQQ
ncbi:MAG: hypothetical protein WCX48_10445 [Bacteroidales bacterium]